MPASGSHFIWILGKKKKSAIHKPLQTPKCEFSFPFTSTLRFLLINFLEDLKTQSVIQVKGGALRRRYASTLAPGPLLPVSLDVLCPDSDVAEIITTYNPCVRRLCLVRSRWLGFSIPQPAMS